MIRQVILSLLVLVSLRAAAQIGDFGREGRDRVPGRQGQWPGTKPRDTAHTEIKKLKTYPLAQYRLYDWQQDTTVIDTALTPHLFHRINFTGRDIYAFQPFQNIGQPLNRLVGIETGGLLPVWAPPSKRPGLKHKDDLRFAHTPTPFSQLYYLSGNEQGQMLDSRFHITVLPNWNINLGYKGLSSLGYYRHSISDHENWFINTHYTDTARRVDLKIYLLKNHLRNEENGGIIDEAYFENPGTLYLDRGKIPVRSEQDESLWHARSEGLSLAWQPSGRSLLKIRYEADYTKGYYRYDGGQAAYGAQIPYPLPFDSAAVRDWQHKWALDFRKKHWHAEGGLLYWKARRSYDTTLYLPRVTVPGRQEWKEWFGYGRLYYRNGPWETAWHLTAGQKGHYRMEGRISYRHGKQQWIWKTNVSRSMPDPAFIIWQSRFERFNWFHTYTDPQSLESELGWESPWGHWRARYRTVRHYLYFGPDSLPRQSAEGVSVAELSYRKDWHWRKWGFFPEITWQHTGGDRQALDLPRWRMRTTFYYRDWWFTHHMYLQTGIRFWWFSSYYMPAYMPLTGTFIQQRTKPYGNFYIADLFFNFKVKKFYAFMVLEHFNGIWERKHPRYYGAPYHPYADYTLRLGIIWQFIN